MLRPVYIIASQSTAEDKLTNLMSLFSVFESVEFHAEPISGNHPMPAQQFRVVAVWMREEGDEAIEFEQQFRFHRPGLGIEEVSAPAQFRFESPERWLHRFMLICNSFPPVSASGIFEVESRVRRVGSEDWVSQRYPIRVQYVPAAECNNQP